MALALGGHSDRMVTLTRESDQPYVCGAATAPLAEIANIQRLLPDEFIGADGHRPDGRLQSVRFAAARGDPLPEYASLD